MRQYIFRGKREDNGEWIEGNLETWYPHDSEGKLITENEIESVWISKNKNLPTMTKKVLPETVGQYTGLTDKNGKKIFEGHIISFTRYNALGYLTSRIGKVCYSDDYASFYIEATTGDYWSFSEIENIKVIGNIHDNPELLKWQI